MSCLHVVFRWGVHLLGVLYFTTFNGSGPHSVVYVPAFTIVG